jgi:uncharacterized phage protein gp47/JayE
MPQLLLSTDDLALVMEAGLRLGIDPTGTGAVNLRPGSDNAVIVSLGTKVGNRVLAYASDRVRARSPKSSTDTDLDEFVEDIFGDKRKGSNNATSTVYLQRTGVLSTSIDKGTRFASRKNGTIPALQFRATDTIPAGAGVLKVAVPVQCLTEGTVGNILQAAIVDISDALGDATWQIFTPAPGDSVLNGGAIDVVAGGADRETDEQLIARMNQRSLDTDRQRGTKAAIVTGALGVNGVQFATPVEPGNGTIILYVGDASYQLSAALSTAVLTEMENWRALGVPVFVRPYNAQLVQVNLRLFMARPVVNYSKPIIAQAATQAILAYFTNLQRPDEYYTEAIVAAAFSAHPEAQRGILDAPTQSQTRPSDAGYGTVAALNRFYATLQSVSVTILDPYHL